MKPSILIVMLDFLVCSLLLFVIGTGGRQTQFATSQAPTVHEEFAPSAIQAQQEEWNREYEQETLLTQLQTETAQKEQAQARLAAREVTLQQTAQALTNVETQLVHVSAERQRLEREGEATKGELAKVQTEQAALQQERSRLQRQTEQLGQTVASQQATIGTLSEQVRASQARMESQLGGLQEQEQTMQQNVAALAEDVKGLQGGLSPEEKARLMQALGDVSKGQQDLQSRMNTLMTSNQGEQLGQDLNTVQASQDALQEQTAKLGEQIESIKARGPGPYQAVKSARLELLVELAARDSRDNSLYHFKSVAYPPVLRVDGRSFIVANDQTLGFKWWGATSSNLADLKYTIDRVGDPASSMAIAASACVLRSEPHVAAIELENPLPGLSTMELAAPESILQSDQRKLHVFKSTAAGLSFEVDAAPDLSDNRYLVIRRSMRGVAAWFENPAYRADVGDYMVTPDGKLVGIMVSRERCFLITKDALLNCAATIPLADKQQFQRAVRQVSQLR